MSHLVAALARGLSIRTACPVQRIEYGASSASGAVLHCEGGRRIRCDKVVIAVPLRILQVSFRGQQTRG